MDDFRSQDNDGAIQAENILHDADQVEATAPEFSQAELEAEAARIRAQPEAPTSRDLVPEAAGFTQDELEQEAANVQAYGGRFGEAAAVSAGGSLTFSALTRLLQKNGVYKKGELEKLYEYNPGAETTGEIAGLAAGALLSGGESLVAKGALKAAAKGAAKYSAAGLIDSAGAATEAALKHALKETTNKVLAKDLIKKSVEIAGRGAAEGALYGANELANEDAVGTADFNAENLMNYAGSGALFGGVAGAIIPAAGRGAKAVASGGKQLFDKSIAKFANPMEDLLLMSGWTKKEVVDLVNNDARKEFRDGLLPWVKDRLGTKNIKSTEDMLTAATKVTNEARKTADQIIETVDAQLPNQPGLLAQRTKVFDALIHNVDEVMKYETKYGQDKTLFKKLQNLRSSFAKRAVEGTPIRTADLREFRKVQDEAISYSKKSGDYTKLEEIASRNRTILRDSMYELASKVSEPLAQNLRQAMQDMHYGITFQQKLGEKLAKGGGGLMPNLMETVQAAGAIQLLGTPGGVAVAGLKFLNSDMKRRLNVLTALKKANVTTERETKAAIANFISPHKVAKKTVSISAMMHSALANNEDRSPPKNKQEAYENVAKNVGNFVADPQKLMDRTAMATAAISEHAPATAVAASSAMIRAVQFLQAKVPKSPYQDAIPGLKPRQYTPSSVELSKFERYMQVIEKPLTVLSDLEQGTLTRDHVEALQSVYPTMYEYIRSTLINEMQDKGNIQIPYSKRVQTSILMDIVGDVSLMGHSIQALQANFHVKELPEGGSEALVQPTQGGAKELQSADRESSDTEAFMRRRSEP